MFLTIKNIHHSLIGARIDDIVAELAQLIFAYQLQALHLNVCIPEDKFKAPVEILHPIQQRFLSNLFPTARGFSHIGRTRSNRDEFSGCMYNYIARTSFVFNADFTTTYLKHEAQ